MRVGVSLAVLLLALAACEGKEERGGGAGSSGSFAAAGTAAAGTGGTSGAAGAVATAGSGGTSGSGGSGAGSGGSPGAGGHGGAAGAAGSAGDGGAGAGAGVDGGDPSDGGDAGSQPAVGCAGTDYLMCEDFESAPVGGTPDGWTKHGDASQVVDDEAHGGSQSLELGAIAVWERRIYHDASALPSAHFGRIYFAVQLPVPDAFVHSTMVALHGDGPTRGPSEYRVVDTVKQAADTPDVGSRIQFLWNVQPENSGEFGEGTSYDREFDGAWHCAEWRVDASDQSYTFWLDGEQLIDFAKGAGNYDGSDIPDSFDELRVGWINYQAAPPGFTAHIDDIALDDERIGCLD